MAQPTTRRWTKLTIWPGDGASPEDFTSQVCGLTSKGFTLAGETTDTVVPDCDDPDLPAWVERTTRSLSATLSGSGVMAEETLAFWRTWALSGEEKNVRVALDLAGTDGYFAGAFVLTSFELTGEEGNGKINIALEMASTGAITWATGAP
jgi:hypothetical protein